MSNSAPIVISGVRPSPAAVRPLRFSPGLRVALLVANAPMALAPLLTIFIAYRATGNFGLLAVLAGVLVAAYLLRKVGFLIVRKVADRDWRRAPTWALANTWTLDSQGLSITDGVFVTSLLWAGVSEIVEERDRFIFYFAPGQGHVLPIRFLDAGRNQITDIRELVAEVTTSGRLGRGVD